MIFKDCSYKDFPESKEKVEGMRTIETDLNSFAIKYHKDIMYNSINDRELKLQILRPVYYGRENDKYPLIVYVQGSGWRKQDLYTNLPNLVEIAKDGYVVASVEYTPSDVKPFPTQVIDVKNAINFLIKEKDKYKINNNKIGVWGDSSGAHTAVMTGIASDIKNDTDVCFDYSYSISCIVDYYGPSAIDKMKNYPSTMDHDSKDSPEGLIIGKKKVSQNLELAREMDLREYISKDRKIPPILIMHGSKDRLVPFNQSVILYDKLCKEEKVAEFYKILGADHGGELFWTAKVKQITLEFFERYLKNENQ